MAADADKTSILNIDKCRRLNRRAGAEYVRRGVAKDEVAIAAIYSAHDLAMAHGRSPAEAIEWLRTALDLQERQVLSTAHGTLSDWADGFLDSPFTRFRKGR